MIRRPPRSTRTYTLLPYTTLFRSLRSLCYIGVGDHPVRPRQRYFTWQYRDQLGRGPGNIGWQNAQAEAGDGRAELGMQAAVLQPRAEVRADFRQIVEGACEDQVIDIADERMVAEVGRPEERRVGKEWVSTCRTRGSPIH